jgi:hypothetical protein
MFRVHVLSCGDSFQPMDKNDCASLSEHVKPSEEEYWERDGIVDGVLSQ